MKILFLCSSNIFRSQIAEAFFNKYSKNHIAESAALDMPQDKMHNLVVNAMAEKNIDISKNQSKKATLNMLLQADIIVLMSKNLQPKLNIGKETEIWDIPDIIADENDETAYQEFANARDIIESKVKEFIQKIE